MNEEERLISLEISSEDYEEGFRKWSEMTATSPSGRHLGLYKALIGVEETTIFSLACVSFRSSTDLRQQDGHMP